MTLLNSYLFNCWRFCGVDRDSNKRIYVIAWYLVAPLFTSHQHVVPIPPQFPWLLPFFSLGLSCTLLCRLSFICGLYFTLPWVTLQLFLPSRLLHSLFLRPSHPSFLLKFYLISTSIPPSGICSFCNFQVTTPVYD
ncbi:hypothetical protein K443DRAFT_207313 [Laccaria amethystina LaAM-08-1]|uniref:Uncharacterized protein n=1 Tax=Laccaria amethystina LaAM-08-1 TaxID=1095629 RepID=A0A0C9X088_9AGAR|nr:hypothetical protein K443DRAFT_207313 [Laccaria amethystina LaAM-08-1]